MVHSANAPVANPAMMRHGRLECLALPTHAVGILEKTLTFTGNGRQGHTARIRQGCLGMTGQCHKAQNVIRHATNDGNAFGNG
jgi:hypothetical protein